MVGYGMCCRKHIALLIEIRSPLELIGVLQERAADDRGRYLSLEPQKHMLKTPVTYRTIVVCDRDRIRVLNLDTSMVAEPSQLWGQRTISLSAEDTEKAIVTLFVAVTDTRGFQVQYLCDVSAIDYP